MSITNYELRITDLPTRFRFFALFYVLCACAGNLFAQNNVLTQKEIDWIAEESFLKRSIQSGNSEQKRTALLRIRNLETESASRLAVPALRDKSEIVRATAAFSVIFLPADEATSVLLPLLQDKKELVRREAAYALGKVGNPQAINPLIQILQKDKVADVRAASAVAFGEIGDVSAIEPLTKILQNKQKPEEEFLRRSAARSIGQIAQIVQAGEAEVQTPDNRLPDKYRRIEKPKNPRLIETFPAFKNATAV